MQEKLILLFPGQGAQKVGMIDDLLPRLPLLKQYLQQASNLINYDLLKIIQEGPVSLINETKITQPLLLTLGYALFQSFKNVIEQDYNIVGVAGHSLGEFTALAVAGSISFVDAVELVHKRGQLMQEAPQGSMAAIIGSSVNDIQKMLVELDLLNMCSIANLNNPQQIVLAGTNYAIDKVQAQYHDFNIRRIVRLPVSVAAHCQLQQTAAVKLAECLKNINLQMPKYDVYANIDASIYSDVSEIISKLEMQMTSQVQWQQIMQKTANLDTIFLELGPSNILKNLAKSHIDNVFLDHKMLLETYSATI